MKAEKRQISITVQREDRLQAIRDICSAIKDVAKALQSSPHITISDNYLTGNPAINIDATDDVHRTEIAED